MQLLDKYIARQFFSTYVCAGLCFTFLFILINFIENVDEFIDTGPGAGELIAYYLTLVPETVLLVSPLGTLLASLYITGRLSGSSELHAMKAAGVAMHQLLKPFIVVALFISLFNIANAGWLSPKAAEYKNRFEKVFLNKKHEKISGSRNLHILESRNRILSIGALDQKKATGFDVSLETFEGALIASRIDAERITYDSAINRWIFYKPETRLFTENGVLYSENPGSDTLKLSLTATSLRDLGILPDEMNLLQHFRYIEEKRKAGFSNIGKVIVKFHGKLALPLASLIIVLIGVPLSARKKHSGLALEFGISLLIGFIFLGVQRTFNIIGYRGLMEPELAAWLPNLVFLIMGTAMYKTASK